MSNLIQLPTLYAALNSRITTDKAGDEKFMKMLHSNDPAERDVVKNTLNAKFKLLDDFLEGLPLSEEVAQDVGINGGHFRQKSTSNAVKPNILEIMGIESWYNTLNIDMQWMSLFQMETADEATEVHVVDWLNKMRHKQYAIGAPIESVPFSTETATQMGRKRYGGGSFADRSLLGTQQRYTVNNLLRGHQVAELILRADLAYASQAAVTPNGTTSYSTSIVQTANSAYDTLIQAMATAGYNVTASTPAYLLCHGSHRAAVNASFATIRGLNGNNQILEYPITPIYTYNSNWPAQFASTNAGMLIFPGQKQIWVNFRGPRVEQEPDPKRDGLDLVYQYYLNHQCFGGQCQIVNLA